MVPTETYIKEPAKKREQFCTVLAIILLKVF